MRNKFDTHGIYPYILRYFIEAIVLSCAAVVAVFEIVAYIENRMLVSRFGEGILEAEDWPNEAYQLLREVDRIAEITSILICLLILAGLALQIRNRIARPLESLDRAIRDIGQNGSTSIVIRSSGLAEIDSISDSFARMREELRESEAKRRQLEDERKRMLAGISHDLRTPLTVIRGYSRAIMDGIADEEMTDRYAEAIYSKTGLMSDLVDSFYEYSRMQHPMYAVNMEEDDICEFLREYLADRYDELDIQGYEIISEIPDEGIVCGFDHLQIRRMFENIISNSIRNNGSGTYIYAGISYEDNNALITLGDSGQGISDELKDKIFQPFVTGDAARSEVRGGGLGLAVCKAIAEAHGGSIELTEPFITDEGISINTVFSIKLPCAGRS